MGSNKTMNRQFQDVVNQLGLSKGQRRKLHDAISDQGKNYQEILKLAKEMFKK